MATILSRSFSASGKRVIAMTLLSLAGIAFGAYLYYLIPVGPIGLLFLIIPMVIFVTNIIGIWRTRLSWDHGNVCYQGLFSGWSVEARSIKSWKLNSPMSRSTAFELQTVTGQKFQIPDISALSITDHKAFSHDFAMMIAEAKRDNA